METTIAISANVSKETKIMYLGTKMESVWETVIIQPTATDEEIAEAIAQTKNNLTLLSYRWLFDTTKEVTLQDNVCPNELCELGLALENEGYTIQTERMSEDFFIVEINPQVEVEAHFERYYYAEGKKVCQNRYILKSPLGKAILTDVESVVKAVNALNIAVYQFNQ